MSQAKMLMSRLQFLTLETAFPTQPGILRGQLEQILPRAAELMAVRAGATDRQTVAANGSVQVNATRQAKVRFEFTGWFYPSVFRSLEAYTRWSMNVTQPQQSSVRRPLNTELSFRASTSEDFLVAVRTIYAHGGDLVHAKYQAPFGDHGGRFGAEASLEWYSLGGADANGALRVIQSRTSIDPISLSYFHCDTSQFETVKDPRLGLPDHVRHWRYPEPYRSLPDDHLRSRCPDPGFQP
jgi:hypothetical protein